jgi:hypothetical protein
MARPGEVAAGVAKSIVAQLGLESAQTVLPPHRTAAVFNGHTDAVLGVPQDLPQPVTQLTGEGTVESGRFGVHIHLPFVTAAVRAGGSNTPEGLVVLGINDLHNDFSQNFKLIVQMGVCEQAFEMLLQRKGKSMGLSLVGCYS